MIFSDRRPRGRCSGPWTRAPRPPAVREYVSHLEAVNAEFTDDQLGLIAGPPPAPLRLIVSFELSRVGWVPGHGGGFRIQLEAGATACIQNLMDDEQWQALTILIGSIVQRIRARPDASYQWHREHEYLFDRRFIGFHPYFDEADIRAYLDLMTPWLPDMVGTLSGDPILANHLEPLRATPPR